jgi:hypothetical protein
MRVGRLPITPEEEEFMERSRQIIVTSDASGAQQAAKEGYLVMIVDVIDMSTTLESALEAGAAVVLGGSPDFTRAPVEVDPEGVGRHAARLARERVPHHTGQRAAGGD